MLVELRDKRATLGSVDRIVTTALFRAANEGKHAFVEVLLGLGLELNGHDSSYWTPLSTACERDYVHCAQSLLEHNADIHKYSMHNKMIALHHAAATQRRQIIQKLVVLRAGTVSRDCYAKSALDYASSYPPSF